MQQHFKPGPLAFENDLYITEYIKAHHLNNLDEYDTETDLLTSH